MREQNYKNLKTEKEGIQILRNLVSGFTVLTSDEKKFLYTILNIDYKKYFSSIDGIILNVESISKVKSKNVKNIN